MMGALRQYYRVEEVAERLGVSLATVYRRINDGSVPSVRLGGLIRIPIQAFEQSLCEKVEKQNSH